MKVSIRNWYSVPQSSRPSTRNWRRSHIRSRMTLRAPLRHMAGYTELLQKKTSSVIDEKGNHFIAMILDSAKRMGNLIDDLLAFSRIGRAETQNSRVNMDQVVKEALTQVRQETEGRKIAWKIDALPDFFGDPSMLRLVLVNLISNAIKFTRTRTQAEIEIGCSEGKGNDLVVFVRDNGVGFDMKYAINCLAYFNACTRLKNLKAQALDWQRFSASYIVTGAMSGPRAPWMAAQLSISQLRNHEEIYGDDEQIGAHFNGRRRSQRRGA